MKPTANPALVILMCFALVTATIAQEPALTNPASTTSTKTVRSIEGTTWAGTDSDGDFYEFTFLPGGKLRYKTNTERKELVTFENPKDTWAQNGPLVVILIEDYSAQIGYINQNGISGRAWNFNGKRWTWTVTLKQ